MLQCTTQWNGEFDLLLQDAIIEAATAAGGGSVSAACRPDGLSLGLLMERRA